MKIGDIVIITNLEEDDGEYYNIGDKAKIIKKDENFCLADFTMNKKYFGDGKWWISERNIKITQPVNALDCSQTAAHNQ